MPRPTRTTAERRARGASLCAAAIVLACLGTRATKADAAPADAAPAATESERPDRWEPAVLPELNYDSNIGFGFGAIGTLARFVPGYDPYRFRLEAQIFTSLAVDEAHHVSLPYHDHFLRGDFPGLLGDRLRLFAAIGFGRFSNSGYYGLGQLSTRPSFSDAELTASESARRFDTYDRLTPSADLVGEIMLRTIRHPKRSARLALLVGTSGAYDRMTLYPGSQLERDVRARAEPTPRGRELASLLHGFESHGVGTLALGLLWDSRDHDFAPSDGNLTELSSRVGYAAGANERMAFVRLHASTRFYSSLYRDVVVFAHRAAIDAIFGDAPFYELSQFGVLHVEEGPGGNGSVRGVLLRRFHGKLKIIDNAELRLQAPWFTILGARFRLGAVAFVDAGRVWSELPAHADLDGPWAPFALGVGGGLRLRWGETFILRADLAASPTDHTTGFSIDLGHVF